MIPIDSSTTANRELKSHDANPNFSGKNHEKQYVTFYKKFNFSLKIRTYQHVETCISLMSVGIQMTGHI